jgi:hypothetical protein
VSNQGVGPLGRLRTVHPREVWPNEARHFTPWLLQNVDVLSDLLGMDLVLDEAEHPVGGFSLDLKGYDESSGEVVIVENQLEVSDHTHLGQIITYAAGTDPTTIVWVTSGFRLEHRAAIDWLNTRTDENTRVFGVVISVVQIGDSVPAPNFELVAQPNDWEKQVRKAVSSRSGEASARERTYREFWEHFLERVRATHPNWTRARTNGGSWVNMSTGTSGAVLATAWVSGTLVSQLYFESRDADLNSTRFEALSERRNEFDSALGERANWDPMTGRKGARIVVESAFTAIEDRAQWPEMADWVITTQTKFRSALAAVGGVPII